MSDMFAQTPYTIMFGPDKCGSDSKLHFIFRHTNPLNKVNQSINNIHGVISHRRHQTLSLN